MSATGPGSALPLTSYRIHLEDVHVRAVPARDARGASFVGPGIDLRGADAHAAIEAARPVVAWLDAREPGVVVRSISVKTEGPRVLISLAPLGADPRPRAMRFEGSYATELRDAARDAERVIGEACSRVLARRDAGAGPAA